MEASIREPHLKDFVRFLQCASRYGDELHMHAHGDVWEMSAMNMNKSAFALFKLYKTFFTRWQPLKSTVRQRNGMRCKLAVKSLLGVLGKTSSLGNVQRLDMKFVDPDASLLARQATQHMRDEEGEELEYAPRDDAHSRTAMLVVKLVCKHGVTKKHSLHLDSSDFLRAEVNPDTTPSGLTADAKQLRDILDHFNLTLGPGGPGSGRTETQLGWMFTPSRIRIKSWTYNNKDMQTEVVLDPGEFMSYEVAESPSQVMQGSQLSGRAKKPRIELSLPMKEFHATLSLAEQLHQELDINFSEAGQPLVLMTASEDEDAHYQIFCAIATSTCDVFDDVKDDESDTADPAVKRSRSNTIVRNGSTDSTHNALRNDLEGMNAPIGRASQNGYGHDPNGAEPTRSGSSSTRPQPQAQNGSSRPSKRPRASLDLSNQTTGSQTVSVIGPSITGETTSTGGNHHTENSTTHTRDNEPLFLSTQRTDTGNGNRLLSSSQGATRMSTKEFLEQSIGVSSQREEAELVDALDNLEEEDELETLAAEENEAQKRKEEGARATAEAEEQRAADPPDGPHEPMPYNWEEEYEEMPEEEEELPASQPRSQRTFPTLLSTQKK